MPALPSANGHAPNGEAHVFSPRLAQPSANGGNGPSGGDAPSANGGNGRDAHGRFARGNKGGPGNPCARRVALLRSLLLDAVTEEHLRGIALTLSKQAQAGNLAGFSDFRHMAVVFRQELGMPPTAYRRQFRGSSGVEKPVADT